MNTLGAAAAPVVFGFLLLPAARAGPCDTDDHPGVTYGVPRSVYYEAPPAAERLLELIGSVQGPANELLIDPSLGGPQLLARVRAPLLELLELSPDFEAAYYPLLRLALLQSRSDREGALQLLSELQRLSPARAAAGRALDELRR